MEITDGYIGASEIAHLCLRLQFVAHPIHRLVDCRLRSGHAGPLGCFQLVVEAAITVSFLIAVVTTVASRQNKKNTENKKRNVCKLIFRRIELHTTGAIMDTYRGSRG